VNAIELIIIGSMDGVTLTVSLMSKHINEAHLNNPFYVGCASVVDYREES